MIILFGSTILILVFFLGHIHGVNCATKFIGINWDRLDRDVRRRRAQEEFKKQLKEYHAKRDSMQKVQ